MRKAEDHLNPDLYHLHPTQENIFYEQLLYENSPVHTLNWYTLIEENVDITLLQKTLNLLYQHIDTLRLRIFINADNEAVQYIQEQSIPTLINEYDVSKLPDPENHALLWMKQQNNIAIDYLNEIPYQFTLIRLANEKNYFFTTFHHIFIDGVGLYRFHEYVYKLYTCLKNGTSTTWLSEIPQYLTAVKKARTYLNNFNYEDDKNYWLDFLKKNEIHQLTPYYHNKGSDNQTLTLPLSVKNDLRTFCHENKTNLLAVFSTLASIVMAELTGQQELVFNTTTHGRTTKSEKYVVGMQANTYPVHCPISRTSSIIKQIKQVESALKNSYLHGKFPNSHLTRLANQDGFSLPSILILYDRFSASDTETDQIQHFHIDTEFNINPILFRLKDHGYDQELKITIQYLQAYFSDSEVNNILERLNNLLTAIIDNPAILVSELPILLEQERHTLLNIWNQTNAPYPQDKSLQQLFEAQVTANPNNVALVFEGKTLTYHQLNERANQLALVIRERYQQQHHVPMPIDTFITLYLDRSPEMVISILAVLKAGGAYVPVSTDYPPERVQFILDDTQSPCVVTQQKFLLTLQAYTQAHVASPALIAADDRSITENYSTENLALAGQTTDLAYVIYTSGTTGKPKGVLQTHHNVSRLFTTSQKDYQFDQHDVWVLFHAYTFDFSVWELWGALLYGGRLIIPTVECTKDFKQFSRLCAEQNVTVLNQTPGAFYAFIDEAVSNGTAFPHLRYVIFGGDKLNPVQLTPWWDRYGDQKPALINMYGITETTVHVTYKKLTQGDNSAVSRIGQPLSDMSAYVLNPTGQLVPIGAPGELYIGGAGLARGYLNRPELTAERFIENPFATEKNKEQGYTRLYKTGDLARWLPDGELEYLGRNDFQVKIRGYRIELGEIESALAAHPQVKQAVVIDRNYQGNTALIAYLVTENEISDEGLISHLSSYLPDYMLPASFTRIEAIPLTPNGKVDRRALPEPVFGHKEHYVAPRNALETQLCAIWQDILALERVGIDDNFFRLGGNSLSAIKLIAAIRRTLSTDISLAQLFERKTIAGLATQMDAQIRTVIPPLAQARYPLSFAQERMLFIEQYEQGSDVYHIPYLVQLTQDTSLSVLETAINQLAERHAVLRTVYRSDDQDQMYQQILDEDLVIPSQSCDDRERLLANVRSEIAIPFDLTIEPSLRLRHYQVADRHYLLLLWHHIAMDGWSIDIFMAELAEVYHALQAGRDSQLPELEITYGDYAVWQRDYLQGDIREQQLAYWQHTLAGYESLALPTDHPRPAQVNYQGRDINFELDAQLSEQLRALARTQETTLYTVLLSAFYVTLAKLSGQDDIVIGTPTDNRHHAQTLPLLGMFVNSLALRAQLQHTDGVTALIAQVHKLVSGAKAHQDMPFEQLIEALNIERDTARHPLFQVMFSVQAFGENPSDGNLPFSPIALDETLYSPAKFDLSLFLSDGKTAITGCLNYALSLFNDTSITRIAESYQRVLRAFVADQQQPLSNIDILSAQERHTLLHRWNQTDAPYPQDKTLPPLFEAQAAQRPDAIAITFEHQSISYGELNRRANRLAHHLIALGVRPDDRVGICLERSMDMVVGILAILKAGGAYLPLDPAYPAERLSYMLEDATPVVLLTQTTLADKLTTSVPTVLLGNPALHLEAQPDTNPDTQALGLTSNHLAYVIYTSGSTGQPKGVMVEHRNVLRLIINNGFADIGPDDCIAHCANPAFDAATWEIWSALLNGSCLHIVPQTVVLEPTGFREALRKGKVTALWLTAGLFNEYLDTLQPVFGRLRYLLVGGDVLNPQKIKQVLSADHPPAHLINGYGPTESTTFATTYAITAPVDGMQSIPIGRPIANTRIYLLDAHQQPVPMGAPGEIYISGEGVARGYLNQPELTTERFLTDPFSAEPGTRMYKTGDLGRWLPDGNIDYLGRNDSQVKIRGFRIELGEIENALAVHPQIKQAVVIDREHQGHKVLVAYLVAEDAVSDDMLLAHLSDRLPDYMLPASFTFMEAIPLTPNGKVNRRALPEPLFGNRDSYVAPRNVLETQLCAIWQDVLALEQVGIDDNFFRIGGNSLTAIKLIAAIRRTLSTDISLAQLFELKTIAGLATQMNTQIRTVIPPLAQARYPLSFAQERMLFIEQYEQGSDVYHIPYLVQLTQDTSLPLLETAINRLAERHAVLRTVYRSDDHDQMYQQILDEDLVIPSQACDNREIMLANVRSEIAIPFDLTTEPSLRLRHYQVADRHYLLLLWHHIAMDGWSIDIFMAELAEVYHALQAGRDSQLPALDITYGDYAAWQRDYLQGDIREQQLAYWQHTLAGYESLALPTDHPRPAQVNYQGRDINFELDAQLSEQLRALARTQETTLYTVLLSAFYVTLAKLSGQDDIVIGTPTDNRHHTQTLPLLGMFVNTLPLRAQLQHTESVTALITQAHKLVSGAKAHQDMPFEQLVEALNIERDTARHPVFQVIFSVQTFGENPSDGNLPFSPVA
uniref:amino acid adenylation domain-containing protein n=1 Tax=Xenorhabdus sp. PB30.3 TaxID=2788941 RepID=UPI001E3ED566